MRLYVRIFFACCLLLSSLSPAAGAPKEGKYDALKRFTETLNLVRNSYVKEVGTDDLLNGAIKGMLQELDPHSTYLNKNDYKEMQETTSGKFFGVGIEISTENNQIIVVSPIEDTPAFKAGLRAGDVILAVDGQPTQDMTTQEAVSKIRGPEDTEVDLLILHKEDKAPLSVRITRAAIPLISVKTRFLDEEGFLWVRLTRFSDRTTEELSDALERMAKKASIKGLVLDLRNNPGGLLQQSVAVADLFLSSGVIVSMRGRGEEVVRSYDARSSSRDIDCPVVVLVNSGTASASEIVAGALQDHNRAVILGERSFGKGSVQDIVPLSDGTAIKLTVALYYTPSGRSIQAEGIQPDLEIPFEPPREDSDPPHRFLTREKDLSRHLENGKKETVPKDSARHSPLVEEEVKTFLRNDNQLRLAWQMVRGLPKISEVQAGR
ncbi:MAG: S41 family peptidase [Desulfovibrio sp.]|jgi:carboxyl-terminal processing protease|nr:S41 family peptidase [Desulfovibrio sp.]